MKEINVQGKIAKVDDVDFERVLKLKWCLNNKGYATASLREGFRGGKVVSMHDFVLACEMPIGLEVHHKDDDKLNNQKRNLTFVTRSENQQLKPIQKNNKTGYKGVCFDNSRQLFMANIQKDGKKIYVGRFASEVEAAKAYDVKAKELFGPNANVNFS